MSSLEQRIEERLKRIQASKIPKPISPPFESDDRFTSPRQLSPTFNSPNEESDPPVVDMDPPSTTELQVVDEPIHFHTTHAYQTIDDLTKEVSDRADQQAVLQTRLTALDKERDRILMESAEERASFESALAESAGAIQALRDRLNASEANNEALRSDAVRREDSITKLRVSIDELVKEKEAIQASNASGEQYIMDVIASAVPEDLSGVSPGTQRIAKVLLEMKLEAENERQESAGLVNSLKETVHSLQVDLDASRHELSTKSEDLDQALQELSTTKHQLNLNKEAADSRIDDLSSDLSNVNLELSSLKHAMEVGQGERDELTLMVEQLESEADTSKKTTLSTSERLNQICDGVIDALRVSEPALETPHESKALTELVGSWEDSVNTIQHGIGLAPIVPERIDDDSLPGAVEHAAHVVSSLHSALVRERRGAAAWRHAALQARGVLAGALQQHIADTARLRDAHSASNAHINAAHNAAMDHVSTHRMDLERQLEEETRSRLVSNSERENAQLEADSSMKLLHLTLQRLRDALQRVEALSGTSKLLSHLLSHREQELARTKSALKKAGYLSPESTRTPLMRFRAAVRAVMFVNRLSRNTSSTPSAPPAATEAIMLAEEAAQGVDAQSEVLERLIGPLTVHKFSLPMISPSSLPAAISVGHEASQAELEATRCIVAEKQAELDAAFARISHAEMARDAAESRARDAHGSLATMQAKLDVSVPKASLEASERARQIAEEASAGSRTRLAASERDLAATRQIEAERASALAASRAECSGLASRLEQTERAQRLVSQEADELAGRLATAERELAGRAARSSVAESGRIKAEERVAELNAALSRAAERAALADRELDSQRDIVSGLTTRLARAERELSTGGQLQSTIRPPPQAFGDTVRPEVRQVNSPLAVRRSAVRMDKASIEQLISQLDETLGL
eukprot:gnl/Dysnectes_brevis/5156_a7289_580.p1 GENE.gnl/Dysnectes_brevis/5156_a7289_580~~gnl/Dysnectes_brevis/5156_a7289_580.p1  ORF type:complete len:930 (+),score=205.15 gnl/Dysnectes_brevis/5156_a7289_580:77-2866(+)